MRIQLLILLIGVALCGCGQGAAPDAGSAGAGSTASAAANDKKDAATPEEAVRRGGAQVINDPSQAQPGGSYVIEPANPNDEKYKADPRLAGGG